MKLRSVLRGIWRLAVVAVLAVVALILVASYAPNLARRGTAKLGALADAGSKMLAPALVAESRPERCTWLDQGWSAADRAWFHNVSQGTATFPVPYAWFRKLELPEFSPLDPIFPRGLISDPSYLARLGFIAPDSDCDPPATPGSPEGYGVLPVGFAVLKGGVDPATGQVFEDGLGLTCAACHTGHIMYKGTELRIDGAPAMIDLENLERVIGLSVCYTDMFPWRGGRFAEGVVGSQPAGASAPDEAATRERLGEICDQKIFGKVRAEEVILKRLKLAHSQEGFGRLDALNRIGNQVFHENLADPQNPEKPAIGVAAGGLTQAAFDGNFAPHTAPVSFPPIWDVPNFLWAQYDASILNPNIRNIGEAMGVAAKINMIDPGDPARPLFSSTTDVASIARIEKLLQGTKPPLDAPIGFNGLQAPKWTDAAGHFPRDPNWDLDPKKIAAGRQLYRALCFECHRSPVRDAEIAIENPDSFWMEVNSDQVGTDKKNWVSLNGERLFNVVQKSAAVMGTDPEQGRVLTERRVSLPAYLGMDTQRDVLGPCKIDGDITLKGSFVVSLMAAVKKVEDQWFLDKQRADGHAMPDSEIAAIKGRRPNCPNPLVFKPMQPASSGADSGAAKTPRVAYMVQPHYRARPLDGVWATAPYLHNGSVPTLDDLLQPQALRPPVFCVGPVEFDPVKVGLTVDRSLPPEEEVKCESGLTRLDAMQRGNSNRGHSFEGHAEAAARPFGVIGRELKPEERESLIFYLKTL